MTYGFLKKAQYYALLIVLVSCSKDDGFREVIAEIHYDSPDYGTICSSLELYTDSPWTSTEAQACIESPNPKHTEFSEARIWPVGTNLGYDLRLRSYVTVPNGIWGTMDVDTTLPCDISFKVKSDGKTIFTKNFSKGTRPDDQEFGNVIIR